MSTAFLKRLQIYKRIKNRQQYTYRIMRFPADAGTD